jgi:hypothetical protein
LGYWSGGRKRKEQTKYLRGTTSHPSHTYSYPLFTGVSRVGDKWRGRVRFQGQERYLGVFDTEEAAAKAHDEKAKRQWKNPVLNFLPDGRLNPRRKSSISGFSLVPRRKHQHQHESRQRACTPSPSGAAAAAAAAAAATPSSAAARARSSSSSKPHRRRMRACVDSILRILDSDSSSSEGDGERQAAAAHSSSSSGSTGGGGLEAAGSKAVEALQAYAAGQFIELEEDGEEESGVYGRALAFIVRVRPVWQEGEGGGGMQCVADMNA